MQTEQRNLIRDHKEELMQLTEVQNLAKTLVDKSVLTQTEFLNIFSGHDERENKERFFVEIQEKELAYNIIVDWLNATNEHSLARILAAQDSRITPYIQPREDEEENEITTSIEINSPVTFDDSKIPLQIQVSLADEFRDNKKFNPNLSFYSTKSKQRGRVLIINNYEFTCTNHNPRAGADVDEANLKELFKQMGGWVVKVKNNLTAAQMEQALKSFTKAKREKRCDICFVFLMSHGSEKLNETIIYGADGHYLTTTQIQNFFTNERCPLFRGKPKVFIYQVCRGPELDWRKTEHTSHIESDGLQLVPKNLTPTKKLTHFRPVDDMLVGHATMPGTKAHRDPYRGTWYIELICKHFMELAKCESVDNLLMKVDESLSRRMSEIGTVQTCEHISKGFKKLYLNPGIYELNGRKEKFHDLIE